MIAHLLEAVEGGDSADSLLGGNLGLRLGDDGGAEEGGGHGGHFYERSFRSVVQKIACMRMNAYGHPPRH